MLGTMATAHAQALSASSQDASTEQLYPKRSVRPAGDSPTFTVTITTSDTIDVSDGSPTKFLGLIRNTNITADTIKFNRMQSLPCGWTSSVCFGENCYSPGTDSAWYVFPSDTTMLLTLDINPGYSPIPVNPIIYLTLTALTGDRADTIQLPFYITYVPQDSLSFQMTAVNFSQSFQGSGKHPMRANIQNLSCSPNTINVSTQQILPLGWSSKICINGDNCASDTTTISFPFAGAGDLNASQDILLWATVPPSFSKTDSAVFLVHVHPSGASIADSGTYRFSMIVNPTLGIPDGDAEPRAGIVVVNAWPNPLLATSKLNLEIMTDRSGPAEAHVYDIGGVEKATVEVGELSVGSNRVLLSGFAVPSGEYIVRIQQDGASSEPIRIRFIK
ncbi:MAG: T9SS type A sorting domain-containing protein [Bacteroidota bacterium]|nr:T9SS type A sorting domain-containing protein [Bacteroidota bacterium]